MNDPTPLHEDYTPEDLSVAIDVAILRTGGLRAWLAAHDEQVRAAERERIATAIEADPVRDGYGYGPIWRQRRDARIARTPEEPS